MALQPASEYLSPVVALVNFAETDGVIQPIGRNHVAGIDHGVMGAQRLEAAAGPSG